MAISRAKKNNTVANLGFEAKLWLAADRLRNNMEAAEYKHVVFGLTFWHRMDDDVRCQLGAYETSVK